VQNTTRFGIGRSIVVKCGLSEAARGPIRLVPGADPRRILSFKEGC
jgi:hypothetical protein